MKRPYTQVLGFLFQFFRISSLSFWVAPKAPSQAASYLWVSERKSFL